MGRVQQKIQFSHFVNGKMLNSIGNYEHMKLWHLRLSPTHLWYMSKFLMKKKLCFEIGTHPPFRPMSQNTQFFWAPLNLIYLSMIIMQNGRVFWFLNYISVIYLSTPPTSKNCALKCKIWHLETPKTCICHYFRVEGGGQDVY